MGIMSQSEIGSYKIFDKWNKWVFTLLNLLGLLISLLCFSFDSIKI